MLAAYLLAAPYGRFKRIMEVGTGLRRAEILLADGGLLETTDEPILGSGATPAGTFDLVIALHVLEHCSDPAKAVADLWKMSERFLLVETPALEVESEIQGYDDVNPGHLWHWSIGELVSLVGGTVMEIEAVRYGRWPCNRLLAEKGTPTIERKTAAADRIYSRVAAHIGAIAKPEDAYLGIGYSLGRLLHFHAPNLPAYDTHKRPVPESFSGRLILTPRYLPTRCEMKTMYRHLDLIDPWT